MTRVATSLQASFVDYGGIRHGFLAFAEIHPDYYQIPVADRKALLDVERAAARAEDEEDSRRSRRPRPSARAEAAAPDAVVSGEISGMDVVDLGEDSRRCVGSGRAADALLFVPHLHLYSHRAQHLLTFVIRSKLFNNSFLTKFLVTSPLLVN